MCVSIYLQPLEVELVQGLPGPLDVLHLFVAVADPVRRGALDPAIHGGELLPRSGYERRVEKLFHGDAHARAHRVAHGAGQIEQQQLQHHRHVLRILVLAHHEVTDHNLNWSHADLEMLR